MWRTGLVLAMLAAEAQAAPEAVVLASAPGSGVVRVLRVPAGLREARGRELGRLRIREDGVARGRMLADGAVVVVADVERARGDNSWGAHLFRVAGGEVKTLARGLYSGSWPVLADGAVLVARGAPGPELEREVRVDELAVDRVGADGEIQRVWSGRGWLALPLGVVNGETVLYRVGPEGAEIIAAPAGAKPRIVARIFPMARDFSFDGGALVYLNRDDRDPALWVVDRVDLTTGGRTRLHASPHYGMAPVIVGGRLWINRTPEVGIGPADSRAASPMGAGQDELELSSGRFFGFLHHRAGDLPEPWLLDGATGAALAIARPAGARVELVAVIGK